jgi:hypothetical protein
MIIYFAIILGIIAIVVFITSRQSIISVIGIGLFYIVEIIVSLLSLKHIFIDLNIHSLSEIIVTILLIGWIRWLIIEFKENFFAVIKDRKEK